jgi:hypothetical protein
MPLSTASWDKYNVGRGIFRLLRQVGGCFIGGTMRDLIERLQAVGEQLAHLLERL